MAERSDNAATLRRSVLHTVLQGKQVSVPVSVPDTLVTVLAAGNLVKRAAQRGVWRLRSLTARPSIRATRDWDCGGTFCDS